MPSILIGDQAFAIAEDNDRDDLRAFALRFPTTEQAADVIVSDFEGAIRLEWAKPSQSQDSSKQSLVIDIEKFVGNQLSFPAAKQGAFNQALGKKTRSILDCTGGWGGDALLMASQGYQVRVLEEHPIMALVLRDAFDRLSNTQWAKKHKVCVPQVIEIEASSYLRQQDVYADCLYLDPMFPPKRKKSAATNKFMEFLKWMLPLHPDNENLALSAIETNQRVVVKRPHHAEPLINEPSTQFSSKLVHYDVYLPKPG